MGRSSKAAVFHGPGEAITIEEFPLPELRSGEALVRVSLCTICGSDLHTFTGRRTTPCPTILGHEIIGRIAALGPDQPLVDLRGRILSVGDRVTWTIAASCGDCFYCGEGLTQKCRDLFKYGHERIAPGHALSGGMAEYCHLSQGTGILAVPDLLSDKIACPVNCATATVAAAVRSAPPIEDRVILIQGAGMLGLTAAAMAGSLGAARVVVSDPDAERLARAAAFAATDTVDASSGGEELKKVVGDLTDGRGADTIFEFCGAPAALEAGLDCLRIGGSYLWAGSVAPSTPLALAPERVVRNLWTISGVHNYTHRDLDSALSFLCEHGADHPFEELVEGVYPLSAAQTALERAGAEGSLRLGLRMEAE